MRKRERNKQFLGKATTYALCPYTSFSILAEEGRAERDALLRRTASDGIWILPQRFSFFHLIKIHCCGNILGWRSAVLVVPLSCFAVVKCKISCNYVIWLALHWIMIFYSRGKTPQWLTSLNFCKVSFLRFPFHRYACFFITSITALYYLLMFTVFSPLINHEIWFFACLPCISLYIFLILSKTKRGNFRILKVVPQ